MKTVILINGFKRAGKDTVGRLTKGLLTKKGFTVDILSMATPLKQFVCTQYGISSANLDKWKNEEEGIWRENDPDKISDFRKLLQKTGDAIKELHGNDNVFGALMATAVDESSSDYIIIPDFRYQVEIEGLETYLEEEVNIITIRIDGDRAEVPSKDHASEWDLLDREFDFDVYITNNKEDTLLSLKTKCMQFVSSMLDGA